MLSKINASQPVFCLLFNLLQSGLYLRELVRYEDFINKSNILGGRVSASRVAVKFMTVGLRGKEMFHTTHTKLFMALLNYEPKSLGKVRNSYVNT